MDGRVTELHVRLVSARNLRDTQTFGTQDPYCIVSCGHREFKTKVHDNGGKNPIWNEKFVFQVYSVQSEQLYIQVKNKNLVDSKLIGECRLQINMFQHGEIVDQWFTLNNGSSRCGEINVRIQLIGAGVYGIVSNAKYAQVLPSAPSAPSAVYATTMPTVNYHTPAYLQQQQHLQHQQTLLQQQQAQVQAQKAQYQQPQYQQPQYQQPQYQQPQYQQPPYQQPQYQQPQYQQPQYQQAPPPPMHPYQPAQFATPSTSSVPVSGMQVQGQQQPVHVPVPVVYAQPQYVVVPPPPPVVGATTVVYGGGNPGHYYEKRGRRGGGGGGGGMGIAAGAGLGLAGGLLLGAALSDDGPFD